MSKASDLLPQSAGYGVLVGVGAFFALFIIIATKLAKKHLNEDAQSTEMFMVANRSVGIGLTASCVYSSWTWATEILWPVTMVYLYGVQAAFWFGAGLAIQITLMSLLGIEAKKKIPAGHTSLEIVQLRYGRTGHILYTILCLINNIVSASSMILGAAGAISALCNGLHIVASTLLIPFGVLLYTAVGGLKSTFLTDYVHSLILLIIMTYILTASIQSEHIGGISGLYDKLVTKENAGELRYIEGNYKGSFLTGKSQGALFFGLIHSIGDMGLTVMDSSFWQKSFSADVKASVPGYLIAGGLIYANVWALGMVIGLGNVVLEDSPIFPTYPNKMTAFEVNSGFGLIYTIKALLGNGALGGLLLVLYLSVTSTFSAQLISVSSIISFDIYRTYIKPNANNKQLINVSHLGVVFFGFFAAGFSIMLHYAGVDMTWFGYFYAMLNCPGVIPMIFSITWKHQTKTAFIVSPILGIIGGLAVWLGTANALYGEVSIKSTGQQLPCLYGGLTALFVPGISTIIISLIKPANYDWNQMKSQSELIIVQDDGSSDNSIKEKSSTTNQTTTESGDLESIDPNTDKIIEKYRKIALFATIFVLLITWVVWPLPLYRDYIWSASFFKGNAVVGFIWLYLALLVIGVFPLWDGRHALTKVFRGVFKLNKDRVPTE
ncbi:putative urea active transporter 3 [Wickerhamomyces ciferrii]|uniref:Urea active transporter 3 n=1 Tax=Wickerhamomyces ciferrii (strain ATCC 14091 / BCRC 22168 / CBS 111 / JCM 3599 / NBRC 0793 / NRRL Y-1031 F-60-10) TaxID=1206466 RepID=K0KTG1_WICCF|nr:putative urea active transporter 3 [Wickerhamomyces ciferrii]CCH44664.1 putative urea active transporter 3 [Wickerhamomyces ciferrii]